MNRRPAAAAPSPASSSSMLSASYLDSTIVDYSHAVSSPAALVDGTHLVDRRGENWKLRLERKDRYNAGKGKFVITFIELYQFLYERKVRGIPRSVVDWLCAHVHTENLVTGAMQQKIAREIGASRPNVNFAFGMLERLEILVRMEGQGVVLLNPRYIFVGSPKDQNRCARQWDELMAERRRAKVAVAVAVSN